MGKFKGDPKRQCWILGSLGPPNAPQAPSRDTPGDPKVLRRNTFHPLPEEHKLKQFLPQQPRSSSSRGRGDLIRIRTGPRRDPGAPAAQRSALLRVNLEDAGEVKEMESEEVLTGVTRSCRQNTPRPKANRREKFSSCRATGQRFQPSVGFQTSRLQTSHLREHQAPRFELKAAKKLLPPTTHRVKQTLRP